MSLIKRLIHWFASLRMTVVILAAALVLVFAGTIAQVKYGLWAVQEQYFQSWLMWWSTPIPGLKLPVYPGGHLIGALLLVNLTAAYAVRFRWTWSKCGIQLIHLGLIIMLIGGLATDLFSVSSYMRLREGETKNYSEESDAVELALIRRSDSGKESVVAIGSDLLVVGDEIRHPALPMTIRVLRCYGNSALSMIGHGDLHDHQPASSHGSGARIHVRPLPPATRTNERNVMSAVLELMGSDGAALGTWLVSDALADAQRVQVGDDEWSVQLRPKRHYKPYSLTLLDFTHETYPGTGIPKDFSSTVLLNDPLEKDQRQVRIYMNHPLRYQGETYYQSGFEQDNKGTVLQVVRNPSYQAPYVACAVMSAGMLIQFGYHLVGFTRRKRKTL